MATMDIAADDLLKLERQLCFAMVTAARNVVSIYRPVLEPMGLTHPQYLVMLALWEHSPRTLGDLAEGLAMDPATASPLVKRLEAQGLIRRSRRADDERRLDIELTEAGQALREQALQVPGKVLARLGMTIDQVSEVREAIKPFTGRFVPVA